ncbi:MAG: winged helix-turn-helix domain-containing protein [Erysipelotrichaceae bacterium]|jgi:DNA-binding response OmpR family regulator|nr:winged helix-turn-helix domain-containing protein [Erysipelotrichaceae bacterium]
MTILLHETNCLAETPKGTIHLTPKEYDILDYLMKNSEKCVSPEELYSEVWSAHPFNCRPVVAVHICHLREKIEIDPSRPEYVKGVWGKGYRYSAK